MFDDPVHCNGFSYLNSASITCSSAAIRLMISETPCTAMRKKPTGKSNLTGHRTRPPALEEASLIVQDSTNHGHVKYVRMTQIGKRNKSPPMMSIQMRVRSDTIP